jgi:hypothetical protein
MDLEAGPKRKLVPFEFIYHMPSLEIFGLQEAEVLYFQRQNI